VSFGQQIFRGPRYAVNSQRFTNKATSSQKMWATSVSTGDQGGEPTLGQ